MFTYRPLRGVQNFYIVSLAVADLAVAVLVMPLNVANFVLDGRWAFGGVVCHVWLTADILTCTASILNLCAIALDRYRAIHDPIGYAQRRTIGRVLATVAVVWATSVVISVPPLVGWNTDGLYDASTRRCQLTDDRGFVLYSAAGSFYIPLGLMTFVYVKIYLATRRRIRARADNRRVAAAATSASGAVTTRAILERREDHVQMRLQRPKLLLEVPSMESLTNDDADCNDGKPRSAAASAASSDVMCRRQSETVIDTVFTLDQPPRTDFTKTLSQQTADVSTLSSFNLHSPEVDVSLRLKHWRSADVVRAENMSDDLYTSDFQGTTCREVTEFTTGRPEVEITDVKLDCADIKAVCRLPTLSAEVKDNASTELKVRSSPNVSAKKRRYSAENCPTRRISKSRLLEPSKWTSMVFTAVGRAQSTTGNDNSSVRQSVSGESQVVGRVRAEKQRQAAVKEKRVARTMAVIMAAFVVCWLPFFVVYVLLPFCRDACSETVGERFITFIVWLGYVNSTINPVIYTVFNVDFRRAFKSLLFPGRHSLRGRRETR